MEDNKIFDIFISYKDDYSGSTFASKLNDDLNSMNYSSFYNKEVSGSGTFWNNIAPVIRGCTDFLLILSESCLRQLKSHEKVDWVREELLEARKNNKNIIPILIDGVKMPRDKDDMPADLDFLPGLHAISLPEQYMKKPLNDLLRVLGSRPEKEDVFKRVFNSNKDFDINEFFSKMHLESIDGNHQSKLVLAMLYYYGLVDDNGLSKRDFVKAFDHLLELSNCDDEYRFYAYSLIGEMYYNGAVPQESQSFEKAITFHKRASEMSPFSAREYSYLSSLGLGRELDIEEIERYYKKAIDHGDKIAILGLARCLTRQGRFADAAILFKSTMNVIPDAEVELGKLYASGVLSDPPQPDYYKAAFYLQHAISSGKCDASAYLELGKLYLMPHGDFPKDDANAQRLFIEAVKRGNKNAAYKLGCMYEYGTVEKSIEKAIRYFHIAAEAGIPLAFYHLSILYQQPEFTNYHKAFQSAKESAEKGCPEGEFMYGLMLLIGRGCDADVNAAKMYLNLALSHGFVQAKIILDSIL